MSRVISSCLKWATLTAFCVFVFGVTGCGGGSETVGDADIERAREALKPFKGELKAALKEGLQEGPENAIWVCRDKAPEIAAGLKH